MKAVLKAVATFLMFLPGWPLAEANQQHLCLCQFVAPIYAPFVRQVHLDGAVQLAVDFDSNGKPTAVSVLKSNSFPELSESLRSSAIDAVNQWRFCPSLTKTDHNEIVVTVIFKLRNVEKPTEVDKWSPTEVSFEPPSTVNVTTTAFSSVQY